MKKPLSPARKMAKSIKVWCSKFDIQTLDSSGPCPRYGDMPYMLVPLSLWREMKQKDDELKCLYTALDLIDHMLTIPAAEYVPAIGDVIKIIDRVRKQKKGTK